MYFHRRYLFVTFLTMLTLYYSAGYNESIPLRADVTLSCANNAMTPARFYTPSHMTHTAI